MLKKCIKPVKRRITKGLSTRLESQIFMADFWRIFQILCVQRNDLFITTKLSSSMPYKKAWQSIEGSLQNLGLEYVDLLVIHEPYANAKEMYQACEEAYHKGLIHAIGISNFYGRFLEDFSDSVRVKPVLNQVQAHIFFLLSRC